MQKLPTPISDLFLLQPEIHPDDRGEFLESYNKLVFSELGITDEFLQDNLSVNKKGVLRGMHFQAEPFAQAKLVSVVFGSVFDVAIDLRPHSPNYKKWFGVVLDDKSHRMLYIPRGFAHGFYVLTEQTKFLYKVSGSYYNKSAARGIAYDDPSIGIAWPLTDSSPILSAQDRALPYLEK